MSEGMRTVLSAFRVLEEVAHTQPAGVGDLARRLRMPKSTVQRALRTMWTAGWICPDGADVTRWVLTTRAFQVGQRAIADIGVRDAAAAVMHELRRETGETAHLMVREGDHAVLIERVETEHPIRAVVPLGSTVPLHGSSNGKAMLAAMPREAVRPILGEELVRYTDNTIVDWAEFFAELDRVAELGYAANTGEWRADIAAVAAPIFDDTGDPVAGLSISAPAGRITPELRERYGALVAEAAARVSATLGHRPAVLPG
ncbi:MULTISPECIES: IclR family transcriptional regulator [unclassified Saccharopolyspora]|uniref:IclR family transcriptional regulator n=1 Tax=unclassified Saccharopolyspora TaxID=2646250 RepID=UPI001CD3EE9C|nr:MULTISPECIES: IclR family transcriptional regulator [unclassified Saccharopolyspora]MCA1185319.1 IclR family transcriptional regulator [Saccharopolyspora sp. 6T]MCA1195775.1 IclR family transcriptional regulator [Saccharopolyspora sp. 6V]MCA1224660.1 IclR family transcriptional regulator [Saccharopolyspora sp. 6M]MCA1279414.1 IclR family transcriptional regulator [Saccharopolyspora sp. 7B]